MHGYYRRSANTVESLRRGGTREYGAPAQMQSRGFAGGICLMNMQCAVDIIAQLRVPRIHEHRI